jgi:hypothetical protein
MGARAVPQEFLAKSSYSTVTGLAISEGERCHLDGLAARESNMGTAHGPSLSQASELVQKSVISR